MSMAGDILPAIEGVRDNLEAFHKLKDLIKLKILFMLTVQRTGLLLNLYWNDNQ